MVYSMVSAPENGLWDYARPLKGCADVSFGKRPIYLVGGFNLFFLGMIGWNDYIIVTYSD